jgi:hypothetical protein
MVHSLSGRGLGVKGGLASGTVIETIPKTSNDIVIGPVARGRLPIRLRKRLPAFVASPAALAAVLADDNETELGGPLFGGNAPFVVF